MAKKIKIVLVEDDEFLANMYETKLTLEGFEVAHAGDGEKGLELAKSEQPEIILLDILLPKKDGWEVLKILKDQEETKDIPVLMLTNLGQEDDVDKGLKMGAVDYLIKAHFVPQEVIDKIHKILKK